MSRRYLEPAAQVTELRKALRMTQAELASRLGVTRRTVIRGEQRGLEIPSTFDHDSPRKAIGDAWRALKLEARAELEKRAAASKAEARRRQNREAAKRYRRRRRSSGRVTNKGRSPRQKSRAKIRKRDTSRKILRKKSPRQAGRRRGRK